MAAGEGEGTRGGEGNCLFTIGIGRMSESGQWEMERVRKKFSGGSEVWSGAKEIEKRRAARGITNGVEKNGEKEKANGIGGGKRKTR